MTTKRAPCFKELHHKMAANSTFLWVKLIQVIQLVHNIRDNKYVHNSPLSLLRSAAEPKHVGALLNIL